MKKYLSLNSFSIAILFFGLIAFSSCKEDKEDKLNSAESTQSALDNASAEAEFDDVVNISQDLSDNYANKPAKGTAAKDTTYKNCAVVTISQVNATKKIVIDFGTAGCTGPGGKIRKGKIIIIQTDRFSKPGSVITTTFDGFFVNGIKVEGTKKVTNTTAQGGNIKHKIEVEGKLTFPDGKTSQWATTRFREWIAGSATPLNLLDDVHSITGVAEGKNRNGVEYRAEITSALELKALCFLQGFYKPSKGVIKITSSKHPEVTIDYGDGSCDNKVKVTVAGNTQEIES